MSIPGKTISIGGSASVDGYSLTNREIPCIINRFSGEIDFAPFNFMCIGITAGATSVIVDKFDSVDMFKGKYGVSAGGNLKLSTPFFFKKSTSIITIGQGTYFRSENENGAYYGGEDFLGIAGFQFRLPGFGYLTLGPLVSYIMGENKSFDGTIKNFSNVNNVRGFAALDIFLKSKNVTTTNKPFLSVSTSISPKVNASQRIPVQEYSVSISIGSVSPRLYGESSMRDWNP